ncbi:uncharacterized protein BJ171DRAFT_250962 [Polychytrium aggregatum]|uniref:uncharacterized protein n=1 Tax=Polychytrium aggregatum TaxID=110093 RepID=UPI0022FDEDB0|nr:uncharacterized protein BJ171DRAFT_250962 [Polychytrium aggregatum]KAI9193543.1 hypothetical protein BJ171DRAFT_250962 [Polychytrium aggregatum]
MSEPAENLAEQLLRLGDEIVLSSDHVGYLYMDGSFKKSCRVRFGGTLQDSRILSSPDLHEGSNINLDFLQRCVRLDGKDARKSVFRIEPTSQFTAAKHLHSLWASVKPTAKSTLDTNLLFGPLVDQAPPSESEFSGSGFSENDFANARQAALQENALNEAEFQRLRGKPVVYGMVIQLRSVHSQQYLAVDSLETCVGEPMSMKVSAEPLPRRDAWFKILPKYKIRSEGEPVRLYDRIILQSVKSESFLNLTSQTYGPLHNQYHDVCCSLKPHGWMVHVFAPFSATAAASPKPVLSGQYIRLYHKEREGYLYSTTEGKTPELLPHVLNPLNPKESLSYGAVWQLELPLPLTGGSVEWGAHIRLRHLATSSYLQVLQKSGLGHAESTASSTPALYADISTGLKKVKSMGKLNATRFELSMVSKVAVADGDIDPTLFVIRPLNTESDHVVAGSCAHLQHLATGAWIHARAQSDTNTAKVETNCFSIPFNDEEGSKFRLIASSEVRYDDYFLLSHVEPLFISKCLFVESISTQLDSWILEERPYTSGSGTKFPIAPASEHAIRSILMSLIYFCTKSGDYNPLKRRGASIRTRQDLLRESRIIKKLINILEIPFSLERRGDYRAALGQEVDPDQSLEAAVDFSQFERGHEPQLARIFSYIFQMLLVFLRDTTNKNQVHIAREFDRLLPFIKLQLPVTEIFMHMIAKNAEIVEGITRALIDDIMHLVRETRKGEFVDCLSSMCSVNEEAVPDHQNYIAEKMLAPVFSFEETWYYKTRCHAGTLQISCSGLGDWMDLYMCLDDDTPAGRERANFFKSTLGLYRALCLGHNKNSIDKIILPGGSEGSELIGLDECLIGLRDGRLGPSVQSDYCHLLRVLFIDSVSVLPVLRDYIFPYERLDGSKPLSAVKAAITLSRHAKIDFENLITWLHEYLKNNQIQSHQDTPANQLTLSVLLLVKCLIQYGYYSFDHIAVLVEHLISILDDRTDDGRSRSSLETYSQVIVECKIQICTILNLLLDIQIESRAYLLVSVWKQKWRTSAASAGTAAGTYSEPQTPKLDDKRRHFFSIRSDTDVMASPQSEFWKDIEYVFMKTKTIKLAESLNQILLDTIECPSATLRRTAIQVLHRLHSNWEETIAGTKRILLVDDTHYQIYEDLKQEIMNFVEMIPDLFTSKHNATELATATALVKFSSLCSSNDTSSPQGASAPLSTNVVCQKMLKNLHIHDHIFGIIERSMDILIKTGHIIPQTSMPSSLPTSPSHSEYSDSPSTSAMHHEPEISLNLVRSCLEFLQAYTRGQASLGELVTSRLDLFLEAIAAYDDKATSLYSEEARCIEALSEIICMSPQLSSQITESQFRRVLELADGRKPCYIMLLRRIVTFCHSSAKRHNLSIVKLLMERKEQYFPLPAVIKKHRYFEKDEAKPATSFLGLPAVNHHHHHHHHHHRPNLQPLSSEDGPPRDVLYCAEVIDLMAACVTMNHHYIQSICQNLLPFQQVVGLISNRKIPLRLKASVVRFCIIKYLRPDDIDVIHRGSLLGSEGGNPDSSIRKLSGTRVDLYGDFVAAPASAGVSAEPCTVFGAVEDMIIDVEHLASSTDGSAESDEPHYVLDAVVPFVDALYSGIRAHDMADALRRQAEAVSERLLQSLAKLYVSPLVSRDKTRGQISVAMVKVANSELTQTQQVDIEKRRVSIDAPHPSTASHSFDDLSDGVATDPLEPVYREFATFIRSSHQILDNMQQEFDDLSRLFVIDDKMVIESSSLHPIKFLIQNLADSVGGQSNNLSSYLAESAHQAEQLLDSYATDAVEADTNMQYDVKSLRILEHLIRIITDEQDEVDYADDYVRWRKLETKKVHVQNAIAHFGGALMAERLLTSEKEKISSGALRLLIQLLDGGNIKIQNLLMSYWLSTKEERFFYYQHQKIKSEIANLRNTPHETTTKSAGRRLAHQRSQSFHAGDKLLNMQAERLEREKSSREAEARHSDSLKNVMRLLQLLVEGHNIETQNYIRFQPDNIQSFDLVKDVVDFLHALIPFIEPSLLDLVGQVLDTLIDFAQGSTANQVCIFNAKIISAINELLRSPFERCELVAVIDIKRRAVLCAHSLLEDDSDQETLAILQEMASTLRIDLVAENLQDVYAKMKIEETENRPESALCEAATAAGYQYAMLLVTVASSLAEEQRAKYRDTECFRHFSSKTKLGKIEIMKKVKGEEKLQSVLFPIPDMCQYLSQDAKDTFLWTVNRDTPESKIEDFMAKSVELAFRMKNQAQVTENPRTSWITNNHDLWWSLAFRLTLALNVISLLCSKTLEQHHQWHSLQAYDLGCSPWMWYLRRLLGLAHIAAWTLTTAEYTLIGMPLVLRKYFEEASAKSSDTDGESAYLALNVKLRDLMLGFFIAPEASYHLLSVVLSVMGLLFPPIYAFHLLDFLYRDSIVQGVVSSVTMNRSSLGKTGILGLIIIFIYGVISFMFFRSSFDPDEGHHCDSLVACFVTVLSYGLRSGGGIGEILTTAGRDDSAYATRMVLDMSFFLIVIVFLLNVIFGIIFDTFGQIRDQRSAIQHDIKSTCFICSIEAVEFQRHGRGFDHHIHYDHNLWMYLFFLVYLRTKDKTEYTAQESLVDSMIQKSDYSFFPIHHALVLKSVESDDMDALIETLEEQVSGLRATLALSTSPRSVETLAEAAEPQTAESPSPDV